MGGPVSLIVGGIFVLSQLGIISDFDKDDVKRVWNNAKNKVTNSQVVKDIKSISQLVTPSCKITKQQIDKYIWRCEHIENMDKGE